VFFCPESGNKPPKELSQINWDKIDYYYVRSPGAKWGDPDANDCIVALDCAGNHRNCGHVLFADGHVEQFRGYEWYREAGLDHVPDNSNIKSNKGMDRKN
jgi:prepilin-type processing-associated H-X9-DG protein